MGESAPDAGDGPRRFFYAPTLTAADNLFRGVMGGLYCVKPGRAGDSKLPWLKRLKADGVFLIDLCPYPVNKLPSGERRRAHRHHAPACIEWATSLRPECVVVCHAPSFRALDAPMRAAGLPLAHNEPIPFPLGNTRARFVADVRAAVEKCGWGCQR